MRDNGDVRVVAAVAVLTAASCFTEPGPPVPADHLVAWWKLDDAAGTIFVDSSGNKHDGNTAGCGSAAAWVPGHFGSALLFDGSTNQCGSVHEEPGLDLGGAWSVSAWVELTRLPQGSYAIFVKPTQARTWNYALLVDAGNPGDGFYTGYNGSGSGTNAPPGAQVKSPVPVALNTWFHVTGTWDESTLTVYVGTQATPTPTTLAPDSSNAQPDGQPVSVLGTDTCCGDFLAGALDDVRIYDRALTAAEVAVLDELP